MDTPQPARNLLLLLLAIIVVFPLIAGCVTTPPSGGTVTPTTATGTTPVTTPVTTTVQPTPTVDLASCTADSDCVPAQCCHPTSCINMAHKGVCNLLCTAVCEGPLDCGAGHCGCVAGTCRVISNPTPTTSSLGGGYSY
jgi:hypothetical protein